jgi:hypothetical protein
MVLDNANPAAVVPRKLRRLMASLCMILLLKWFSMVAKTPPPSLSQPRHKHLSF